MAQCTNEAMRNTFIHVFGKPVENPPRGGGVKKLHRASKDPSEKFVMEPGGGSQCALRSRGQSDQGPVTQGLSRLSSCLSRPQLQGTCPCKAGEGQTVTEARGGDSEEAEAKGIQVTSARAALLQRGSPALN